MRASSLFGPATAGLATLLALPTVHALTFDAISIPDLDLSSLGRVTITGDFDGISLYEYEGQSEITRRKGSSILTPLPNGILTNLTSADAQIRDMCAYTKKDGTFGGIFVAGNFTSLGGVDSPGAALFNPNSSQITALSGLNGSVSTVLCDQSTNRVYVGGDFSREASSNAAVWTSDNGWTDLSFDGFNGPVASIIKDDNDHIIFGGSFTGLGNITTTSSSSNNTKQILNLSSATITADAKTSLSGYEDPTNIVCSTSGVAGKGKTYLLHDYAPGYWRADLGFTFFPTKVRLYNTHLDGRGTKDFLFRALPDDGIMNLTYTDTSGNKIHCDSSCPLSSSTSEKYRDFTLVNPVGMKGFQIEVLDWYGEGAGLNGIEVFQDQIMSYAVDNYNEPSCAGIEYPSKSTSTGTWTVGSGYLTANVTDSTASDTSVVFEPDVKESGNYTILVYTPGCIADDTCDSRGMVNVTAVVATDTDATQPSPTTIYQSNDYDKYDTLFSGYVDAASSSFRPRVTLQPIVGQGDITVVASKVRFELLSASNTTNTTGSLNGLYDYNPKATSTANLDKSDINKAGTSLSDSASINKLAQHDGVIYVAGNFSDSGIHNVMSITDGNATAMPSGGLNAEVLAMVTSDSYLYVGGKFTGTSDGGVSGFYHVASYSYSTKKWSAMGDGLNGPVNTIYPIELNVSTAINETTYAVSGDFDQIRATSDNPAIYVAGFAIWVPSQNTWLQSLNDTQMEFAGQLSAVATYNDTSILAGSLATDGISAGGAVSLQNGNDLNLVPLDMNLNHTTSSIGVFTGVYDTESGRNLTIVSGQFVTTASNGSIINNLAFLNSTKQTITGLPQGLDSNSTFYSMVVHNDTLYAGGLVTGTIGGDSVSGLVSYDLSTNTFQESQPWSLHGDNVTVNSIAVRPGSSDIYVGGNFETAGSLTCTSVCAWDPNEQSYSWPGVTISGTVLSLTWASSSTLYAVGDLEISGNKTVAATFSTKSETWTALDGASSSLIPGNITAFTPASEDMSEFWVAGTATNGSAFLLNYAGSKFASPGNLFSKGTEIRGMEILPLAQDHSAVSLLKNDQTLLIMGNLVIPGFGMASAALYNGTAVTPFILSSKYNGKPGSMSRMFTENQNPYASGTPHHSNGIVVLVAFCCALSTVFLIVACGVIMNKIQRRRQGYAAAPQTFGTDRPTDMTRVPPQYLFSHLGATHPTAPTI
ncbi:hypothetical protein N7526_005659 [Penicillium atrosanguineum]|nr:hypothetical protein N7526_005659 [Penicillium atrosanguineum]